MGNGEFWHSEMLMHHGILGMKWGVRRYQNKDGTLTMAGRKRYISKDGSFTKKADKELSSEQKKSLGGAAERQHLDYIMNPSQSKSRDSREYKKEVAKAFNSTSKETREAIDKIKNAIDDMIDNYVDYPSYKKKNESMWAQIDAVAKMACKDFGVSPNLSNKVKDYFLDYLWENSRYLDLVGGVD